MKKVINRRDVLSAAASLVAMSLTPVARACEFDADTLKVMHPWTRATAADAPFAVVCMGFAEIIRDDRLIGVITPVARSAEMWSGDEAGEVNYAVFAGRDAALTEQGLQLRLTGLRQSLELGRSYPMQLVFESGGILRASLNVDFDSAT